ncbi:bifunctional salicylyl-CoA 5-hydroxylase/oxidoreductase [Mycolicibacterium sp. BiH015]|uniref:bifunctional salicylyl-CoA 5-hydroxylase/oxidoreductase n=1 Tax=Mycolicibacterium sp. BiH015 TaxID=3018808 RepID=UPI0022E68521|nr:bifunctional salicylyl-CoA 5-hydroxylase/oxidoreductase [Mycolicibacterium sp. BiH015]MDA2893261.1 bifunctional salicylyl-CoA 5-hydroxylase/oxidoreductase [Mycolicibacterium sp. BiH015]
MRIAIIGGGPGGLYFAALAKQLNPAHQITVWERNACDDTFGFGVVFSDETLGGIEVADTAIFTQMQREFARWDDIDVHLRDSVHISGGHGFAAMSRKRLLLILQRRCRELGVELKFTTLAPDVEELAGSHDLVLAADGVNSAIRTRYQDEFGTTLRAGSNKYIWLGTDKVFEAFKFYVREYPWGVMQIHGYPYGVDGSTVIVEMNETYWRRAGFAKSAGRSYRPGESDDESVAVITELLGDILDGHEVMVNNSRWLNFTTVRNATWRRGNVVLLGDAAHTAHFSIGSGTKLAMEDALALAACVHEHPMIDEALHAYERERRPVVESTQRAAQASLEWFENIGQYVHQDPQQFAFNLLTRSRRITHSNLRLRDADFVDITDRWFADQQVELGRVRAPASQRPPMFQPYVIGDLELKNRILVSSMDMYCASDGVPGDFHLVHLGSKALGGAGLVMTEMVCVSAEGRITPGCTGLYAADQEASWKRVVDFVHDHSTAKIGVQLGHSGRKGSTKLMWEGIDEPLEADNWDIIAPSPIPYGPRNQTPREVTGDELARIVDQFRAAAAAAARAGFDVLELHCAHGYLLSSFLSPLTNHRRDEYGGSRINRLRFPLQVFDAIRAVWPTGRPLSVRISATDWAEGGNDIDDAVEIARAFAEHGVDIINVSTGQVVKTEQPAFGRSYQTPFADRIRNEIGQKYGITVVAVGAISSFDDANSILLAGRADLVAIGRTHLYNPHWTLHAAAEQDYAGPGAEWPNSFKGGSRKPPSGNADKPRPRLELLKNDGPTSAPPRWRPGAPRSPRDRAAAAPLASSTPPTGE